MSPKVVMVTGGLGFIGSHFIELLLRHGHKVINIDKVTYASNQEMGAVFKRDYHGRYLFIQQDIGALQDLPFCDFIVSFAAESHVDNSIADAQPFIDSNVHGQHNLLRLLVKSQMEGALHFWRTSLPKFIYISTDEVFGEIDEGAFKEDDRHRPGNPYSASKSAAEMLTMAWGRTYGLPYCITRTTNNYGERQHAEKLIPHAITQALQGEKIRIHGSGEATRNWIHVEDNCRAIYEVMMRGEAGETYHISSPEEYSVNDVVRAVLQALDLPWDETTVEHVQNRAGQDRRYALDSSKMRAIGWQTEHSLESTIVETIAYYKKRMPHAATIDSALQSPHAARGLELSN